MDICPRCTGSLGPSSVVCPHCGINTAFYTGPELGPAAARPVATRRPRDLDRLRFPVGRLTLILFALGLAGWWLLPVQFPSIPLAPARANAAGHDPCAGKQRCVLVFLAPWCPACKISLGTVRGLMTRFADSDRVGIKPVIGNGRNPSSMEEMAAQIGPGTFLDPAGRIMTAAGVSSVPHWFVLDDQGFLLKKVAGVIPNVPAMISELDLAE